MAYYDPSLVARSIFGLARSVGDVTEQGNRHSRDMAALGLKRAALDYRQGNQQRTLESKLADADYQKKMDDEITLSAFLEESGIDPGKYRDSYGKAGIDIDGTMVTRRQGHDIWNALGTEKRGADRSDRAATMKRANELSDAEAKRRHEINLQSIKNNKGRVKDRETYIARNLGASGIVFDPKRGYGRVADDGFGNQIWEPASAEGAQHYTYLNQRFDEIERIAAAHNVNIGTAEILLKKMETKAIERNRISKTGGPQVGGLAAAVQARKPQPAPLTPQREDPTQHPITKAIIDLGSSWTIGKSAKQIAEERSRSLQ